MLHSMSEVGKKQNVHHVLSTRLEFCILCVLKSDDKITTPILRERAPIAISRGTETGINICTNLFFFNITVQAIILNLEEHTSRTICALECLFIYLAD